ncbi:MAG: ABC transporter permease subunit [Verrucomicrobia bacterium]|nr:ABC transporter permease subunit [Verrucomicrobiota bacterium]
MKHFFTILSHELRMLLVSFSTYIAAVLFLFIMGFIFTTMMDFYSTGGQETTPAVVFFQYFWVPVLFMVPLLTMKSIAEERRLGTLETLLTTPVSTVEVVLGKYFAAYFLYLALWACTGGFFYILHRFAHDTRFMDIGPLAGGFVFVAISGLMFVAMGIFASALSRNQAVAGIISGTLLFTLIVGSNYLPGVELLRNEAMKPVKAAVDYAQIFQHLSDFSHGVVDARQVLFYLSGTVLFLIFSIFSVEVKLLHS